MLKYKIPQIVTLTPPMHYYILLAYIGVGLCVLYIVEYGDTSER